MPKVFDRLKSPGGYTHLGTIFRDESRGTETMANPKIREIWQYIAQDKDWKDNERIQDTGRH
jgi:hypothetical protein